MQRVPPRHGASSRPITSVAVALLLGILVAACGSTSDPTAPAAPGATAAPAVSSSPEATAAPSSASASGCTAPAAPTTAQTDGPYFTPGSPKDADLTTDAMPGTRLTLSGMVVDTSCVPLAGAKVDVWQADSAGVYDNAGYTLRGPVFTDADRRSTIPTGGPGAEVPLGGRVGTREGRERRMRGARAGAHGHDNQHRHPQRPAHCSPFSPLALPTRGPDRLDLGESRFTRSGRLANAYCGRTTRVCCPVRARSTLGSRRRSHSSKGQAARSNPAIPRLVPMWM